MSFFTLVYKKVSNLNPQELVAEREQLEKANELASEHPGQDVPITVGEEKFKVVSNGYGREAKPA